MFPHTCVSSDYKGWQRYVKPFEGKWKARIDFQHCIAYGARLFMTWAGQAHSPPPLQYRMLNMGQRSKEETRTIRFCFQPVTGVGAASLNYLTLTVSSSADTRRIRTTFSMLPYLCIVNSQVTWILSFIAAIKPFDKKNLVNYCNQRISVIKIYEYLLHNKVRAERLQWIFKRI